MMSQKMAHRWHHTARPHNPNLRKSTAKDWFLAKMNKKKLPQDRVVPSKRPSYRDNEKYRDLSIEKYEKKYG